MDILCVCEYPEFLAAIYEVQKSAESSTNTANSEKCWACLRCFSLTNSSSTGAFCTGTRSANVSFRFIRVALALQITSVIPRINWIFKISSDFPEHVQFYSAFAEKSCIFCTFRNFRTKCWMSNFALGITRYFLNVQNIFWISK